MIFSRFVCVILLSLTTCFAQGQEQASKNATAQEPQPVLKLEATIRGSREQPKVMSIVPWQPPTEKQALPSPVVLRINQQFQPLNRADFQRQVQHFEKLSK